MKSPESLFLRVSPGLAVLPNPVPDRQPCSALCRMASLGPLPQTEIMAGFPEKVSDWTVIHFYPRCKTRLEYSDKPVNDIQSPSGKPVIVEDNYLNVFSNQLLLICSITPLDEFVKTREIQFDSITANGLENFYCGNHKIHV